MRNASTYNHQGKQVYLEHSRSNHRRQVECCDAEGQREVGNYFILKPLKLFFQRKFIFHRNLPQVGVLVRRVLSGTGPDDWTYRDTHCIHKMRDSIQPEILPKVVNNLWL
ncbi:MAG: hypothetical protein [Bacteriophage sp.]|nr:MAG: hypothetical protein [Bacteriophage sp.]